MALATRSEYVEQVGYKRLMSPQASGQAKRPVKFKELALPLPLVAAILEPTVPVKWMQPVTPLQEEVVAQAIHNTHAEQVVYMHFLYLEALTQAIPA